MTTQFVLENGLLVQKLFVGPMPLSELPVKRSIAKVLDQYENVSDAVEQQQHLKEQQQIVAATLDHEPQVTERFKRKVIRRRKKFVYNAADEVIAKGYWKREKRSLTKFHSNSLMYEYSQVQGFDGDKSSWLPGPIPFKPKVIRRKKQD